jgi:predicted lactoylglutathione lyase
MHVNLPRKIFVNLPVRDLDRSIQFFAALGFTFNPRFTDEKAACMIVSDKAFVMLLTEPFFKTFTDRRVCNTAQYAEGLFALSCTSRAEVDEMVTTAIAAGGKHAMNKQDHGFMYGRSFYDLDGHHWEVIWMDSSTMQKQRFAEPRPTASHADISISASADRHLYRVRDGF